MSKGWFYLSGIIFLITSSLNAMDVSKKAMIKIIIDGKESLVPLIDTIQEYAVDTQQIQKKSSSLLRSTFNFICSHPKETLEFFGCATIIGGIIFFAKNKHDKEFAKHKTKIFRIRQKHNELKTTIQQQSQAHISKLLNVASILVTELCEDIKADNTQSLLEIDQITKEIEERNTILHKFQKKHFANVDQAIEQLDQHEKEHLAKVIFEARKRLEGSFNSFNSEFDTFGNHLSHNREKLRTQINEQSQQNANLTQYCAARTQSKIRSITPVLEEAEELSRNFQDLLDNDTYELLTEEALNETLELANSGQQILNELERLLDSKD